MLVILDLTIPCGMGGAEALAKMLEIDPHARALVSSGYSTDPIMATYEDFGFCGVLRKPYSLADLSDVLNDVME